MTQYFSTNVSVALTLVAAVMWGSWMQIVKHRGKYPITGLIFLLYAFSLVLVGGITLFLAPALLEEGIWATTVQNPAIAGEIIFGGALMGAGLYFSLQVMSKAGLLLATTISGAVGGILGLATSFVKEGLPDRPGAVPLILLITVVFMVAGFVCNAASRGRDRDSGHAAGQRTINFKVILMALVSSVLTNGWSIGTATGTANSFPPILTCLYMALGSFLSALVLCGISVARDKNLRQVLCIGHTKKPLALGVIAAVCHYGGNLLSIYSMPALSATLSFLFGRAAGLVTIAWGIAYHEFRGSGRKTKWTLAAGIVIYLLAIALLGIYTYGG